jgi:hypothetical protein
VPGAVVAAKSWRWTSGSASVCANAEQLEPEAGRDAVGAEVRDLDDQVGWRTQEDGAPGAFGGLEYDERAAGVVAR